MIHERLDQGCKAKILYITDASILFTAYWPASQSDKRRFEVRSDGNAYNTVEVGRDYFEKKYGKVL